MQVIIRDDQGHCQFVDVEHDTKLDMVNYFYPCSSCGIATLLIFRIEDICPECSKKVLEHVMV